MSEHAALGAPCAPLGGTSPQPAVPRELRGCAGAVHFQPLCEHLQFLCSRGPPGLLLRPRPCGRCRVLANTGPGAPCSRLLVVLGVDGRVAGRELRVSLSRSGRPVPENTGGAAQPARRGDFGRREAEDAAGRRGLRLCRSEAGRPAGRAGGRPPPGGPLQGSRGGCGGSFARRGWWEQGPRNFL